MADCIELHIKGDSQLEKYFEGIDLSKEGGKEKAIQAAIKAHEVLFKELQDFKKSISPDPKKFKPTEYVSPDTSEKVKEITDRYNNIIKNTKISEDELIIAEDPAENKIAVAKLTKEDNIEQEPNVKAIEQQSEVAAGIGSKEIEGAIDQANELINAAIEVVNVPISEIKTNEQEYQGRKNKFSERSANNVAENFDKNKLQPIVVYKHPDGNTYVLSGHSRLEGMKRRKATTIPATYFEGTPQEAIDFSLKSNKLGTLQTDIENAAYYRKKLLAGESYNAVLKEAKENEQEGSAKRIVSIAHLNPNGKAMQALEALDKGEGDTKNNILNIATKIGDIRAKNDHLTNAHENELFEFMAADKKNIPTDKDLANASNTLNRSINNAKFTPEEPLNLDRVVNKSANRIQWEKELREIEEQQTELKLAVNPSKKTGWTGLKDKAIRSLIKGENTKEAVDKAALDFENNVNGVKDAYQKQLETKRGELASVNDKLAKHLLREKDLIQGDKAQQSLFSIQSPTTQEISDMKDIVKDYVDEGTASLQDIQNDVAKELGDNSQEMKDLVEKAYNEFYKTKESTPIEVTGGVIGRVGKFLSRLFGGTAASKVFIAKDEKALMQKYDSVVKDGDSASFQMTMPNGKKATVKRVDVDVVNGFYSPLEKTINEFKGDKLPAKQWADKFKGEEAKWTGLTDWLNSQTGSVSKSDIQKFLKENRIEVVEVVKGGKIGDEKSNAEKLEDIRNELRSLGYGMSADMSGDWFVQNKKGEDIYDDAEYEALPARVKELAEQHYEISEISDGGRSNDESDPKYSGYQLPGEKTNYKEVLITMPEKAIEVSSMSFERWYADEKRRGNYLTELEDLSDAALTLVKKSFEKDKERYKGIPQQIGDRVFKSNHWSEPNILAHVRMNTRLDAEGKKVLFIEELQSDWGEVGRKKGFDKGGNFKIVPERGGFQIYDAQGDTWGLLAKTKEEAQGMVNDYMSNNSKTTLIPSAPFVTDTNAWTKLAFKVALKEAVKQGADKIAWTTGEQQAERYDLSKQVDYIQRHAENRVNEEDNTIDITISLKAGGIHALTVDKATGKVAQQKSPGVSPEVYYGKPLSEVIGKDMAEKVMSAKYAAKFQGNDLKVGGEGMTGFYGNPAKNKLGIVGNVAKSLFKQEPKTVTINKGKNENLTAFQYDGTQDISGMPGEDVVEKGDWIVKDPSGFMMAVGGNSASEAIAEFKSAAIDTQTKTGEINESTQHSVDITPEMKEQVETGLPMFMKSPDGKILGFSHDGKIYLNGAEINTNTPIHEASHIWTEWAKLNNTEVYNRGMQLTENSKYLKEVRNNEFYKAEASKLGSEGSKEYSDYMKHEALAMAIGDKGAQFVGETRKKDFKEWLNNLWNKIKAAAGFKDITAAELQNLTFDEFTKRAAADILRDEEQEQPKPKEAKPKREPVEGEGELTGITHAETDAVAAELGLPTYDTKPETMAEWDAEVDKRIKEDTQAISKMLNKLKSGVEADKYDQRMMMRYLASLKARINVSPTNELLNEYKEAKDLSDIMGGREVAKSLVARKGLIPVDDSMAGMLVQEIELNQNAPLTEKQKEQVIKEYEEIKAAEAAYNEKISKLESDDTKKESIEVVKKTKISSKKTKKTHDDYVAERKKIEESISEKLKKARGEFNVTPIPYAKELFAIAPDVTRLMKSYVEEGISKLGDIITNIQQELQAYIPQITEQDVHDIIAGNYNGKRKTRNEISAAIFDLREEAKLITRLSNLINGIEPTNERQKIKRNQEIESLRNKIKEFGNEKREAANKIKEAQKEEERLIREFEKEQSKIEKERLKKATQEQKERIRELGKKTPEEIALQTFKTRTANKIKELENDLATGNFDIPIKKDPIKLDKEALDLKDKMVKLKMDRQLRIIKQQQQNLSNWEKAQKGVAEIFNIPRTLMTIVDYSAMLRQGIVQTISHPSLVFNVGMQDGKIKLGGAAADMIKAGVSQKMYDRWFFDLKETPRFALMEESGLGITDSTNPLLSAREEGFMSSLAEKIPIIGKTLNIGKVKIPGTNLVKGSERSYSMFLNKMRVDVFNRFADAMQERGLTFENSPEQYKQMADYVNNSTGRGNVGEKLNKIAPLLNSLFFSPRLIASRLNMLTYLAQPRFYKTVPKEVREAYFKDMGKFIGLGMLVLGLFSFAGGEDDDEDKITVETDPRSSDFGKIKQGNTRWDIWGGFQQYVRVAAQAISGQRKSANSGKIFDLTGEGPFGKTRADIILSFARGKLAPVPAMAIDMFSGRTTIGDKVVMNWGAKEDDKEVSVDRYLKEHLTPLVFTGLMEAIKDQGVKAIFTVGVTSIFGVGTQTYDLNKK